MTTMRLRYVDRFTDRHGKPRFYFRRPGGKRVPLPGLPGSAEFMDAYTAALDGKGSAPRAAKRRTPGTFDALAIEYFKSGDYRGLAPATRAQYRRSIERILREENIGHRQVAGMTRDHVKTIMGRRENAPGAANETLKKLRALINFALEADPPWRKDDPTHKVQLFRSGSHHTWTYDELATFEARWPIGTRERTIYALLLCTGQRIGDVVKMSWRDIEGGAIHVHQGKTDEKLWIPMHPALAAALKAWKRAHVAIITTAYGRPFSAHGLGNQVARSIELAGLPDRCVAHGLRKAAARRLAEAGCSAKEIAAITGHKTLKEVERYTAAADQKRLAFSAMEKLKAGTSIPNPEKRVGRGRK
jgi:enterobacteria phage integrase